MAKKKVKKRINIERPYNGGTWSKAEYFARIRSALRRVFMYYKPLQQTLELAKRPSESGKKLQKWEYQCSECKNWFSRKEVQIDHIVDAGSLNSYEDIVPFIQRLTAENSEDYQVLCKEVCHKKKTLLARKIKKDGN